MNGLADVAGRPGAGDVRSLGAAVGDGAIGRTGPGTAADQVGVPAALVRYRDSASVSGRGCDLRPDGVAALGAGCLGVRRDGTVGVGVVVLRPDDLQAGRGRGVRADVADSALVRGAGRHDSSAVD